MHCNDRSRCRFAHADNDVHASVNVATTLLHVYVQLHGVAVRLSQAVLPPLNNFIAFYLNTFATMDRKT